ncbi:molybdate ABC transporter permease subunit [Magnetospira thiophila]
MMENWSLGPLEVEALRLSVKVAGVAVVMSLIPAMLCAWILSRRDFWGKSLLDSFIHLPLVLPPVVVGYGLWLLLGPQGSIGSWLQNSFGIQVPFSWLGAALASAVMAFPLFVRALRSSMEALDPQLEGVARTLGATRWRVFWRVTLPLISPGIWAGMLLAFARAVGEFGATLTFVTALQGATLTLPLALRQLIGTAEGASAAGHLCLLYVGLALGALLLSEVLARRVRRHREAES